MKRFFATPAMKLFCAWVIAVTVGVGALLVSGRQLSSTRRDPDPRTRPVYTPSSGGGYNYGSSGYSGGHHSWSTGGSSYSFGK